MTTKGRLGPEELSRKSETFMGRVDQLERAGPPAESCVSTQRRIRFDTQAFYLGLACRAARSCALIAIIRVWCRMTSKL
jgi:hypothetical protein